MRFLSFLTAILPSSLSALTIQIDYTYDTNNFFDTQEKRDAMEAAAQFFGDRIPVSYTHLTLPTILLV